MTRLNKPNTMENEGGVAEPLAAVLLIAVIALGIGALAVALFSQQPAPVLPSVTIDVNYSKNGSVAIRHLGGETIPRDQLQIYVDNGTVVQDKRAFQKGDGEENWANWSIGDILTYTPPHPADAAEGTQKAEVMMVYSDLSGGEYLLHVSEGWKGQVPGTTTPTPTVTGTPTPTPTVTGTPTPTPTVTGTPTPTPTPTTLVANFTANITSGQAPLAVAFTDTSTGGPVSWSWNFGDGNTSTAQNPVHTYTAAGTYTVSLSVTNAQNNTASHTKVNYINVTPGSLDFIIDENVFIYGNTLKFGGSTINGPGATAVILGGLTTNDLNGGATIAVSNLYIGGDVNLDGGGASLGSAQNPGSIYVNGDLRLWGGARNVYGNVYVNGDFDLKDARIHGNVYVNGNLTLGWTPWLADNARIYYTGTLTAPANYNQTILAKCIHQATVPGFEMPDWEIPPTKPQAWYTERGYIQGGTLTSNMKVFAPSYSSTSWQPDANNVIIVAYDGDITITGLGGSGVTGVFIAPKGKVTFNGASLEGVVIARDGFFVTSGGTTVTFRNLSDFITDPADYPL
ncbi:PKD domain-containing protein [Methanoculleus sp.]|uniref:PKD domain-containing protein n=1 Tax=Methanoculleus sp. TaxID=90427 RepID=UPI00260B0F8D|nr:PKD domain-containing protein [Methanoculleus sp.]MDI6867655.1 PKD domain-containing protein [Methanoculleus sp.]